MVDTGAAAIVIIAVAVGGCATSIRGTMQVVALSTTPSGAQCSVVRDGAEVAAVDATPGSATIARTARDLVIVCRKDGYHEARTLLIAGDAGPLIRDVMSSSERDAAPVIVGGVATAGAAAGTHALVGAGLAGSAAAAGASLVMLPVAAVAAPVFMMVDAASGAYFAYPASTSLLLIPRVFADDGARDRAFDQAIAALDRDDAKLRERFDASCGLACKRSAGAFEDFLAARRADLVRQREVSSRTPR